MKKGYCNGSDMLLYINGKAIGHCTSHKMTVSTETTDHAVKPPASEAITKSLFKEKSVTGVSVSIQADALVFYGETETGYQTLFGLSVSGEPVKAKCVARGSENPYFAGDMIIDSLERNDDANTDSTCSISLINAGAPDTLDATALSEEAEAED